MFIIAHVDGKIHSCVSHLYFSPPRIHSFSEGGRREELKEKN